MIPKNPDNIDPRTVFMANGYEDEDTSGFADVISSRKLVTSAFTKQDKGGEIEYYEITDLRPFIEKFIFDMENKGKFDVTDENGNVIGSPKDMPTELMDKIYKMALCEINDIYESFPPEVPVFDLFDEIESIDASVLDYNTIEISIWPKQTTSSINY